MTGDPSLQEGANVNENGRSRFAAWLPTRRQMRNALQLNIEPVDSSVSPDSVTFAGMRQGMGLIVAAALIAGLLPSLFAWTMAARVGTATPLAQLSQLAEARANPQLQGVGIAPVLADSAALIAGLEPAYFPGWLAAGITALGGWINWPLSWLNIWIVYGLGALLLAKLLGAKTTLQQFYTLTSFAFLPLVLTALGFIPCLGIVVNLVALLWAAAIYVVAVRSATGLSTGLSILCALLPGAVVALLAVALAFTVAAGLVTALIS